MDAKGYWYFGLTAYHLIASHSVACLQAHELRLNNAHWMASWVVLAD